MKERMGAILPSLVLQFSGTDHYMEQNTINTFDGVHQVRCEFCAGVLCTKIATRGSESSTRGSGSSFSVGYGDQCGVLHGDYRFPT